MKGLNKHNAQTSTQLSGKRENIAQKFIIVVTINPQAKGSLKWSVHRQ